MSTGTRQFVEPVGFGRLLRVQGRIWLAQRGVVVTTVLTVLLGLVGTVMAAVAVPDDVTAAALGRRFIGPAGVYGTLWIVVGAVAGAAPFKSRWAAVVLAVAPTRLRWLAACYVSLLGWTLAATAGFGLLACAVATGSLAADGNNTAAGVGVLTHLWHAVVAAVLSVTVGFFLAAATRSVIAVLLLGFVAAPAAQFFHIRSVDVGRWLDLELIAKVTSDVTGATAGPLITALCLWIVAPALLAGLRLLRSPVR